MRFFVMLTREDRNALSELAHAANRQPRDQAIYFLSRAIRQAARRQARRAVRASQQHGEVRYASAS
ncbi:MAG TPA: hypothetical protein VGS80_16495 [Ktedonobacterales bacterium]|nr:hypothetical protein [Ktedonobacterales bacterium]